MAFREAIIVPKSMIKKKKVSTKLWQLVKDQEMNWKPTPFSSPKKKKQEEGGEEDEENEFEQIQRWFPNDEDYKIHYILHHLKTATPQLFTWNKDNMQVKYKGEAIGGSNLIDILTYFTDLDFSSFKTQIRDDDPIIREMNPMVDMKAALLYFQAHPIPRGAHEMLDSLRKSLPPDMSVLEAFDFIGENKIRVLDEWEDLFVKGELFEFPSQEEEEDARAPSPPPTSQSLAAAPPPSPPPRSFTEVPRISESPPRGPPPSATSPPPPHFQPIQLEETKPPKIKKEKEEEKKYLPPLKAILAQTSKKPGSADVKKSEPSRPLPPTVMEQTSKPSKRRAKSPPLTALEQIDEAPKKMVLRSHARKEDTTRQKRSR